MFIGAVACIFVLCLQAKAVELCELVQQLSGKEISRTSPMDANYYTSLVQYDSMLIVGGYFPYINGHAIDNLATWDGSSWGTLEGYSDGSVSKLVSYSDSLFVVSSQVNIWDGVEWTILPVPEYIDYLEGFTDFCIYQDTIYAAGYFYNGFIWYGILRWDGSSWSSICTGLELVNDMFVYNDELYIAGGIDMINNIFRWNGSRFDSLGHGVSGTNAQVRCLAEYDGKLCTSSEPFGHFRLKNKRYISFSQAI